jgi:hypothetical protein
MGSIPDEIIVFFSWSNVFNRTTDLGSTQPVIEVCTRNLPGDKADNHIAICESVV